ncbi:hypothetical protein [Frigoribacterium sp. CFBP 13712]|uniref:hypothetical protein n=1 Tax=Frigoribacterium sp. CFBP 13712 TaxID=2775309 RepID=UPI00177E775C|nr:hypothetical protein [Frigoribacterium sp. CFBP 13712]MBD8703726.1 hypothetical protein [Frigoribacterium sp. CFBP 13712]
MTATGVLGGTGSGAGPGSGSVEAIERAARARSQKADDHELAAFQLREAASWAADSWQGRSGREFAAATADVAAELTALAAGLERHASTLRVYARAVEAIQDRLRALEARRTKAHTSLMLGEARVEAITREAAELAVADPTGVAAAVDFRAGERSTLQRHIDDDQGELRAVERAVDELEHERAAADRRCIDELTDPVAIGRLRAIGEAAVATPSAEQLLALLGGLSRTDLGLLLDDHPELVDKAFRADPERVRAWWDELGRTGPIDDDGLSPEQAALVVGAPMVVGSLDGLPPSARVLANRVNAGRRRDELEAMMASGGPPGARFTADEIAAMTRERAYLEGAVAAPPTVQLYLFDPAADRIIEMIGEFGPETTTIITYVPGTGTTLDSFYREPRGVQQVGDWFAARDGRTVTFVAKDGRFPQTIPEANVPVLAEPTAARLVGLQNGLRQSYDPALVSEAGIGHSWGLANVTSSEVAGAHYDHVVSLAGAGMPSTWQPREGTTYTDYRYLDFLQVAQWSGQVWSGRNPGNHWAFDNEGLLKGPHDAELALTTSLERKMEILVENHSLIAQNNARNLQALERIERLVTR